MSIPYALFRLCAYSCPWQQPAKAATAHIIMVVMSIRQNFAAYSITSSDHGSIELKLCLLLQEAAKAARRRAQGRRIEQAFLEGADPDADALPSSRSNAEDAQPSVEQQYSIDLAAELQVCKITYQS